MSYDERLDGQAWPSRRQDVKLTLLTASMELSQALPTYAHYALTELVRRGHVKYIVSTNLDGLHRRSGIHADEMSELHGNWWAPTADTRRG